MGKEALLRSVQKKFYGDDVYGNARWFDTGEVVDLSALDWPNADKLQRARYLRPLEYGEDPVEGSDGRWWINQTLADRHPGSRPIGDRASSPGVVDDDPGAAGDDDTDTSGTGDENDKDASIGEGADEDESAQEDDDAPDAAEETLPEGFVAVHIGGGWWHIDTADGKRKTTSPMRKADLGAWVTENLKE